MFAWCGRVSCRAVECDGDQRGGTAGTTHRLWWRRQTHRYRRLPTMSGSTLAWPTSPSCPPVRSSRTPATCVARARALARAQKSLARKTKGSKRRANAAGRVAVQHRKVRDTRLDAHHKLAHRIVGDNQAIYVEDLAVSGLAVTRLAKSVHDAGWSTLVRSLQQKALRCHRTVVRVSRWFPSSRLCSVCGVNSGKKPLAVRSWTCTECGITHDRDLNGARNILVEGRKVAAGLAETPKRSWRRRQSRTCPSGCL